MSANGMSKKKGARDICLKSGSLELEGGGGFKEDGWRDREGGRQSCGLERQRLRFRPKCQMSQRHSGKTLLLIMAPQSAVEAENSQ